MKDEMNRSPLLTRASLVAAFALAALVGCGVPLDSHPQAITPTTLSTDDVPPTTSASPTAQEVSVYFLNNNRLEEVRYPVAGQSTVDAALTFVLAGPAKGSPAGLTTAVPPDTALRSVVVTKGVAIIDLSTEINDISGENQKQAYAQLVFTALSFQGIQAAQFHVAGAAVDAPTDHGNLAQVTASDYDPPLNPR